MIPDLKLLGAAAAVITAMLAYNHFIENPHVRELERVEQESACTIRTQDAANRAREVEEARWRQAGNKALEDYRAAEAARERLRTELQEKLEREISDYEEALVAAGRSCLLDQRDVDWLRGKPGAAEGSR